MTDFRTEFQTYCDAYGPPDRIELMLCDVNGILRGKWLPGDQIDKLIDFGVRLPLSTYAANIFGAEVPDTGLGGIIGDPDGVVVPVCGTLAPVPWVKGNVAQVLVELNTAGQSSGLSSREILNKTVNGLVKRGFRPVIATELEFYVIKKRQSSVAPPEPPDRLPPNQNYDLEVLSGFEAMLTEIQSASALQGLATDTIIAEYGPGQFEVNFHHTDNVLNAADTALLFRRLVRGVVEKHGFEATFMAKPYAGETGSGMHVHASVLDGKDQNIFHATDGIAQVLCSAVAGLLETMPDLQAIFAPHLNSYRRFSPSSFAPHRPDWAQDHRGAAVRIPETKGKGARLEHRISGADVNPYLVLAAILFGIQHGLETKPKLRPALDDPKSTQAPALTHDWSGAVDRLEGSEFARKLLGKTYRQIYVSIRRFEMEVLGRQITPAEYSAYLSRL